MDVQDLERPREDEADARPRDIPIRRQVGDEEPLEAAERRGQVHRHDPSTRPGEAEDEVGGGCWGVAEEVQGFAIFPECEV